MINSDCCSNYETVSSDNDDVFNDLKNKCIDIREALKERGADIYMPWCIKNITAYFNLFKNI